MASAPPTQIRRTPIVPVPALPYHRFASRHPAFIREISEMRTQRKQVMEALEGLGSRAQRDAVRQLLHSRRFSLVYTYEGVLKAGEIGSATPQSIAQLANRLDPFRPVYEHVKRRWVAKPQTRMRAVQSFGPLKRAHQLFVADVVRALHPPRANQFLFHGGIPAALKAVEAAYRGGMSHAVELDVTDFYGSIQHTDLAGALRPLPGAVVRNVVFDETIRVMADVPTGPRRTTVSGPPPLNDAYGLPLGAASSPIVGEVMIGRLLATPEIDFGSDIIAYADNLLVLGRSEQEAAARADHLATVATSAACGSLRLREKGRGHMLRFGTAEGDQFMAGVPFVGQLGHVDEEGRFSWEPCAEKQEQHRIADGERLPTLVEIERAERQVAAFHRAYPSWEHRAVREAEELASLASARYMRLATPEHLSGAARAIALAYLLNRGVFDMFHYIPDHNQAALEAKRERLAAEARTLIALIVTAGDMPEAA